jgi:hypothetical protein
MPPAPELKFLQVAAIAFAVHKRKTGRLMKMRK